jgi:hypothetical protein
MAAHLPPSLRALQATKHTIRLSPYAHELLMHFLHNNQGMMQLAALVNQYLSFEVTKAASHEDGGVGEEGAGGEEGGSLVDGAIQTTNEQPIRLQLLKVRRDLRSLICELSSEICDGISGS